MGYCLTHQSVCTEQEQGKPLDFPKATEVCAKGGESLRTHLGVYAMRLLGVEPSTPTSLK